MRYVRDCAGLLINVMVSWTELLGARHMRMRKAERVRGVAMVEFAIIAFIFFGVIGAFYEIGIAFFHYNLLVHSLTYVARGVGADVLSATTEAALISTDPADTDSAPNRAKAYLEDTFGVDLTGVTFTAEVECACVPVAGCSLTIRAVWPIQTFFGIYLPDNLSIEAEGHGLIEDECYACTWTPPCTCPSPTTSTTTATTTSAATSTSI